MLVNQYYYDPIKTTLSEAVLLQVAARKINNELVKVYVRRDEAFVHDDFGNLDVVMLAKDLQPSHFQIGLKRKPKILQVERTAI